jgi:competence protein ComEA
MTPFPSRGSAHAISPHHTPVVSSDASTDPASDAEVTPPPRSLVRIGVGAAVVVVLLALVCAVLVSIVTPHGRTDTIALAAANGGHVVGPTGAATATPSAGATGAGTGTDTGTGTDSGTGTVAATPGTGDGGAAGKTTSAATSSTTSTSAAAPGGAGVVIHILGSVARPGLYQLAAGARVVDAVAAAGGFTATADQGQQNLARVVKDGEQIVVPELGAAPPLGSAASVNAGAGASGSAGATAGGTAGAVPGAPATPVNINTADETTLETLPHVGPQMGARIIAWRTTNGPFTQVDDLKNVSGIGDKTFAELEPLVTV